MSVCWRMSSYRTIPPFHSRRKTSGLAWPPAPAYDINQHLFPRDITTRSHHHHRAAGVEAATVGADPEIAGAVVEDGGHTVATQTPRIVGIVRVVGEGLGLRIEPVEPTSIRSDPQHALGVLVGEAQEIASEGGRVCRVVAGD